MLLANLVTRVYEESGDFSIDADRMLYSPYRRYAGIKSPQKDKEQLNTGANYTYEVASVDYLGKPQANTELDVKVYKVYWYWWWDSNSSGDGDADGLGGHHINQAQHDGQSAGLAQNTAVHAHEQIQQAQLAGVSHSQRGSAGQLVNRCIGEHPIVHGTGKADEQHDTAHQCRVCKVHANAAEQLLDHDDGNQALIP